MRRDVYQAIADPVRREIIGLLANQRLNLNSVAEHFPISRPAISKHIKILRECGLVSIEQQGRERYCQIQPGGLNEVADWVEQFRALWEQRLDNFGAYLETLKAKNTNMAESNDLDKRVLTLERTFNAPLKLVWDAWTQAEHIVSWWGPKGMDTKVETLDFRPGGKWKYIMATPNGDFVGKGEFLEIIEHQKIVLTADFHPVTKDVVLTVELEAIGEETKMTFSVLHQTEEYAKAQEEMGFLNGWGSTFGRLAELVEGKV